MHNKKQKTTTNHAVSTYENKRNVFIS